jgi:hypothetical protein
MQDGARDIHADRVGHAIAGDVLADANGLLLDVDPDEDEPVLAVGLGGVAKVGCFLLAGWAPCRPDVDPDGMALLASLIFTGELH